MNARTIHCYFASNHLVRSTEASVQKTESTFPLRPRSIYTVDERVKSGTAGTILKGPIHHDVDRNVRENGPQTCTRSRGRRVALTRGGAARR